jgi:nucleotide-binding universal stress UspA family protein
METKLSSDNDLGSTGASKVFGHRPLRRILVGVDGSPSAAGALAWAASLLEPGGRVHVVHAVPTTEELMMDSTPFGGPDWRRQLRNRVSREWCACLREWGVAFDVHIVERGVAGAILSVAEQQRCDLIVVGARRHHDHVIRHQATLATHLDHRTDVPVLCVPFAAPQA